MTDDIIDIEGFEKYGPTTNGETYTSFTSPGNFGVSNGGGTPLQGQGFQQEWFYWTSPANLRANGFIVGLNGTGVAFCLRGSSNGAASMLRGMPANYTRVMLGFAFMWNLGGNAGIQINDAGTAKVAVGFDGSGRVVVWRGGVGGTVLFTSGALIHANTRHYLEVDFKISNTAGHYQVWMDGVSLVNSDNLQNTSASGNAFVNQINPVAVQDGTSFGMDDMYWRDNTGGTATPYNDVAILGRVPTSDNSVQFTPGATVLGPWYVLQTPNTQAVGANSLLLVPVTPAANMTINSVGILPGGTTTTVKLKGVIYSDNAGAPGSLLSSGTEVVGVANFIPTVLPLVTPQALTGGTQYWVGFIYDTTFTLWLSDSWSATGQFKANTYTSGAPAGPLSGMTTGQSPYCIWGNCTGAASNYAGVNRTTPPITGSNLFDLSYNQDSTVGHEDLFEIADMTVSPSTIITVKASVLWQRDAPGPRTGDIRVKSGSTDSGGTVTGITPGTNMGWSSTRFDTDPDTGLAWTQSGINGLKVGYKVAS